MDGSIDQVLNFNENQISFHLKALIAIKDDEIVRVVIEIWRERVRIHLANFFDLTDDEGINQPYWP